MVEQSRQYYEYIVVGCGGVGSATIYWLSKRVGKGVLGLEQFELGHKRGSSHGHSRLTRLSSAREDDVVLQRDAYKTWQEVESESGLQILYKTGGLIMGRNNFSDEMVECFIRCMEKYKIGHQKMDGTQIRTKFQQFTTDANTVGAFEESAGLIDPVVANGVHAQLARYHGATIRENCSVTNIYRDSSGRINVDTTDGKFQCRHLTVAAGAWTNNVLKSIGVTLPLSVRQEQVTYLATPNIKEFTKDRFPVWFYFDKEGLFYGFPVHGNTAVKVAVDLAGPVVTAETRSFIPIKEVEEKNIAFMKRICPKAVGPVLNTETCLYTMVPDGNFIVDNCKHVGWPDISVCIGGGRMFKFVSLMGKILRGMAIDGKTEYDLSVHSITREAIVNPNYKPTASRFQRYPESKL